jgi:plasmid stability protein
MRYLTIRNVPRELADALEAEKRRRGQSLNRTVLDLLAQSLGQTPTGRRSNGLARLGGTWTEEEYERFEAAVAVAEQLDEELWR